MRIRAVFIGKNHSMNYINGQEYILQVLGRGLAGAPEIVYSDPPAKYPVPYGSWEAFWKNWDKNVDKY